MSLSANTNVASTVANYFNDNYQALLQAGTTVPATAYMAPATQAFADWKIVNNDKKFYLEKSGDSYKLGSVTGSASIPQGAEAVDMNVAYAIESKEMTLVDWMMAKIGDEIRRDNALQASGSLLSFAPEADVNFDPSSMSQADLTQLLKRLSKASDDLRTTNALSDATGRQSAAAALGLSASRLGAAMEQQALFQEEAATLTTGGEGADNFNEVLSAAYAQLVAGLTADLEAAKLAYEQTAASTVSSATLSGLTNAAGSALNSRLKSAADLALLTNPNVSLFSALDVQETDDGYVVNTSAMSSRDAQKAAVRAALEEALNDPALLTALADAMAANADNLGTADMALPDQTKLYNEVAAAVISAIRSNDGYLDELASNAVDFGNQLSQMLGNELVSASKRDNAEMTGMN